MFGSVALALTLGLGAFAEDYQMLKCKTEILVDQVKEFRDESDRKGSELHTPQYQYYFRLMYATGTNLLARAESPTTVRRLNEYFALAKKDYDAYTRYEGAYDRAEATGSNRGRQGAQHRAKRIVNAKKLGEQELLAAIARWEKFVAELKREAKR